MGWQCCKLDRMQITCNLLQTDNPISTSSLNYHRLDSLPRVKPTTSNDEKQKLHNASDMTFIVYQFLHPILFHLNLSKSPPVQILDSRHRLPLITGVGKNSLGTLDIVGWATDWMLAACKNVQQQYPQRYYHSAKKFGESTSIRSFASADTYYQFFYLCIQATAGRYDLTQKTN